MDRSLLEPCPACEKPLSITAFSCPSCGYKKPLAERLTYIINTSRGIEFFVTATRSIWQKLPNLERGVEILLPVFVWPFFGLFRWKEKENIKRIYAQETWTIEKVFALCFVFTYWVFASAYMLVTGLVAAFATILVAGWLLGRFFGLN